jgi:DMSO/TMAO reductase YedYZ molybdopterin-dependent catalytic subunit
VSLPVEHGEHKAQFEGPLLWSLLDRAGAVDASKPGGQVRQTVLITGSDGYTAVLALGEISPEFAAKPVILADRMDGHPLGPEHLRLIVPGERRGGRSVRDVVRISVNSIAPAAR